MNLHVFLEIEVGNFIFFGNTQKFPEFLVADDFASVSLVLEFVFFDVLGKVFGNLSASHFSSFRGSKESTEIIRNKCGFGETTWGSFGFIPSCLFSALIFSGIITEMTLHILLETSNIRLKGSGPGAEFLDSANNFFELFF